MTLRRRGPGRARGAPRHSAGRSRWSAPCSDCRDCGARRRPAVAPAPPRSTRSWRRRPRREVRRRRRPRPATARRLGAADSVAGAREAAPLPPARHRRSGPRSVRRPAPVRGPRPRSRSASRSRPRGTAPLRPGVRGSAVQERRPRTRAPRPGGHPRVAPRTAGTSGTPGAHSWPPLGPMAPRSADRRSRSSALEPDDTADGTGNDTDVEGQTLAT